MNKTHDLKSLEDTSNLAKDIAYKVLTHRLPRLILLEGNLGSGKTTFSQYFAKYLNIKNTLTSPTFVIMKSYAIPEQDYKLHHLDLYRLEKEWELEELEIIYQIQTSEDIFLIEWSDKFPNIFDSNEKIILNFEHQDDQKRIVNIRVQN